MTSRAWQHFPVGISGLSPRQREIVELRCRRGLSNEEAAYALHIRESTVKNHVTAIRDRIGRRTMNEICFELGRIHQVSGHRPDEV